MIEWKRVHFPGLCASLKNTFFLYTKDHSPDEFCFQRHVKILRRLQNPAKIRIVARRRFWRFLLVNKLPLSIMAAHAQYRDTVPLNSLL